MQEKQIMIPDIDTLALFAVVGVSMVTSLTLLVRVLARELGSRGQAEG